MNLRFLGGAREVGRSAVLVNDSLLLDYGTLTGNPPQFPVGSVEPDAVVASHGHLDHVGSIPALLSGDRRPPIHWTPPTRELALLLARDTLKLHGGSYDCPFTRTEIARVTQVSEAHGYGETFSAAGHEVTFLDAGHVPGSAHVLVDDGDTRLLYTGDFHVDESAGGSGDGAGDGGGGRGGGGAGGSGGRGGGGGSGGRGGDAARSGGPVRGQRLVAGSTARPDADVVLCESTYADVEHEARAAVERRFVDRVESTIWNGGTVVVPAFAIGRTQELMLVCEAHDIDCYVDGMGQQVTRMLERHPEFVRDPDAFRRAKSHARFVTGRDGQRRRIAEENTVIITTSGMLSGGPAMTYVPAVHGDPTNLVALTGHQVEGTPGDRLLETGRAEFDGRVLPVSAQVEAFDFSAHADRHGLRAFLDSYRDAEVLVNHGDRCEAFAEELRDDGFDASAPEVGDAVST